MTPIVAELTTTSVVSSSFSMTLSAIQTSRRRDFVRRAHRRRILMQGDAAASHPSIDTKEEPAIIEHLMRVYGEVLSIPPIGVSLVFEEDLVVEYIGAGADGGTEGVIRKSAFRIMGERADIEWSVSLSTNGMDPLPPHLALTSHPHHSIFVSRL